MMKKLILAGLLTFNVCLAHGSGMSKVDSEMYNDFLFVADENNDFNTVYSTMELLTNSQKILFLTELKKDMPGKFDKQIDQHLRILKGK